MPALGVFLHHSLRRRVPTSVGFVQLPYHLFSSSPGNDQCPGLKSRAYWATCAALFQTPVSVVLFPILNVVVHGHQDDPVLKVSWFCSFFLHHILEAFENLNRRLSLANLPHEFQWSTCNIVIRLKFWALDEFSDAIVFPSFCCLKMFLTCSAKTQNRTTEYIHFDGNCAAIF